MLKHEKRLVNSTRFLCDFFTVFPLRQLSVPGCFAFALIFTLCTSLSPSHSVSHVLHCVRHHSWPLYMCVSAFMCESRERAEASAPEELAFVCEKWRVPRGWWQLKFSVQWSAPVLLAGCVKHIKGSLRGWLMTRFPSITCATSQP